MLGIGTSSVSQEREKAEGGGVGRQLLVRLCVGQPYLKEVMLTDHLGFALPWLSLLPDPSLEHGPACFHVYVKITNSRCICLFLTRGTYHLPYLLPLMRDEASPPD